MAKEKNTAYDKAYEEMKKKEPDKKKVFSLLEQGHEQGDPRATYALATWYLHGEHVEKDIKKATKLLKQSAAENVPDALYDLAISYEKGIGVKKDKDRAFELYLKAALRGDDQSVEEVARCYYYGIGVKEDERVADIWYERAEELGLGDDDTTEQQEQTDIDKINKDIIKEIESFVGQPKFMRLFLSFDEDVTSFGFCLGMGKELVLMQVFHDFYSEGYEVIRLSGIKRIESKVEDSFFTDILREEGILKEVGLKYEVDLTDFRSLIQRLFELKKPVIIECEEVESDDDHIVDFILGKIIVVKETSLVMHGVDAAGNWDDKPTEIDYRSITKVQFDTPYLNTFLKYVNE